MSYDSKPLKEWTYQELGLHNQAQILIAIPQGTFNDAVHQAMQLTMIWVRDRKESENDDSTQ